MNYSMTTPCSQCPYLIGSNFPWVALEAHASGIFYCHKACDTDDGDEESETYGAFVPRDPHKTPQCAGALIWLEKQERPNQAMRMAERLGWYDRTKLNMSAPVYERPEQCRKPDRRDLAMFQNKEEESWKPKAPKAWRSSRPRKSFAQKTKTSKKP